MRATRTGADLLGALVAVVTLGACTGGGGDHATTLPPITTSTPTTSETSAPDPTASAMTAAADAVSRLYEFEQSAAKTGQWTESDIRAVATGAAFESELLTLQVYKEANWLFEGKFTTSNFEVSGINVVDKPSTATVTLCVDATNWAVPNVPESRGERIRAGWLVQEGEHRWIVSADLDLEDKSCD